MPQSVGGEGASAREQLAGLGSGCRGEAGHDRDRRGDDGCDGGGVELGAGLHVP